MKELKYDIAVIGAGAAGLSAAAITAAAGKSTLVIDREPHAGGILRQCIHNGFGLRYFHEELTGPEYAERVAGSARSAGAEFLLSATVTSIAKVDDGGFLLEILSETEGVVRLSAHAVVLAMGCRERNRGNIATPGTRPAGVFTAGTAQKLLNLEGALPGKSAVIVGSGDIGLIMARRLRWCGIEVKAVVEIMPYPAGLTRNIVQCLNDFQIPLYLEHSVVNILGRDRVEGVELAPLHNGIPEMEKAFRISCDTLLFSVGLVPETELAVQAGVELNPATNGAIVDANYETSVSGIFSAGNVLHVHDLVDFVSEEAARMARRILERLDGAPRPEGCRARVGANLKYVVPWKYFPGQKTTFSFRPMIVANGGVLTAALNGKEILRKGIPFVRPAEMLNVELTGEQLSSGGDLVFNLQTEEEIR